MLKKSLQAIKDFWGALPHPVQAAVVTFAAAAAASIGEAFSNPANVCRQWTCLRHDLGAAIGAGIVALRVFYMVPNRPKVTD